jgi:glucarate dehydratase
VTRPAGTIREVVVTPVAVKDPPLLNAFGVHQPYALRSVIQVRTESGVTGLGESYGEERFLQRLLRAAAALPGSDVFDLLELRRRVEASAGQVRVETASGLTGSSSAQKTLLSVLSAFEVACLDAQGRLLGRPVTDLLGGRAQDHVPFSAYLFYKWAAHPGQEPDEWGAALDPDGIVAQARVMAQRHGFRAMKLKGGVFPPDQEVAAVQALHAAFPGTPLRIDPNTAWTVATSLRVAGALDGVLEYLEDPTPGMAGMAEVAAQVPMPLATNMCVVRFEDLPEAVRTAAVGVVLADHHYWGGLRLSQRLAGVCETFGLGVSMHSNTHLGISLAAMVQLAAATPRLAYSCDTHSPWQAEDVIQRGALAIVDGAIRVPDGPGLGVELDGDALQRLHEQYERCGIRTRDDEGYRRSVEPGFTANRARW